MKIRIFCLLLGAMLHSNISFSAPCPIPKMHSCAFYGPDIRYVGIKINFEKKHGIVYVDGGCAFGIHPLSHKKNSYHNTVKTTTFTVDLIYCTDGAFIKSSSITVDDDINIYCNASEKFTCTKHKAN